MMLVQRCTRCARNHLTAQDALRCLRLESRSSEWRQYRPVPSHFDPDEPAFVYLMTHPSKNALKIGVTRDKRDANTHALERVQDHKLEGWRELHEWYFAVGFDALDCEELVLDRWKNVYSSPSAVDRAETATPRHRLRDVPAPQQRFRRNRLDR
ncbi:MAG: hypothetical protein ACI8V4_000230 [Ilumatobacter sp.]|jgi:hypothetical protein